MSRPKHLARCIIALVAFYPTLGHTEDWNAKLAVALPHNKKSNFQWVTTKIPVFVSSQEDLPVALASVDGMYLLPNTKLLIVDREKKEKTISVKNGKFSIPVALTGTSTTVKFVAIRPTGQIEREEVTILFYSWPDFQTIEAAHIHKKLRRSNRPFYNVSLGFTSLSYTEGSLANYSGLTSTLKFSYLRSVFPPNWDVGGNIFITLANLTSSMPDTAVHFLGANLRFGYVLPFFKDPWRASILAGVYYSKMFVTSNSFGFKTLIYPQVYPTVRRALNLSEALYAYLKYVPTNAGPTPSWKEKEIGLGIGWERLLSNRHPLIVSVDYTDFKMVDSLNVETNFSTISLSLGYGL
jgi:hypothetical protein